MQQIGKLKEVNIRKVWSHEQYGFSAWLATEENIKEIGDLLGLNLIDIETEKFIGKYRCDIVCKDEISGKIVLLENQIEDTNHDHLGKVITYASGLGAQYIVWITTKARDEHAKAVEWLNNHTDEETLFFLIEVHAYQIGDSLPAPQFQIIEQPNDFSKNLKLYAKDTSMTESDKKRYAARLEFWNMFNDILEQRGKPFNKRKANHWYDVAVGSSQCYISIELVKQENKIRISIIIPDNKELYDRFFSHKEEIENDFGESLEWQRTETKRSKISTYIDGLNFDNQDNYKELINKVIDLVIKMRKVFRNYL